MFGFTAASATTQSLGVPGVPGGTIGTTPPGRNPLAASPYTILSGSKW